MVSTLECHVNTSSTAKKILRGLFRRISCGGILQPDQYIRSMLPFSGQPSLRVFLPTCPPHLVPFILQRSLPAATATLQTLKMKAVCFVEMSGNVYQTTWWHIPGNSSLLNLHRENLKSQNLFSCMSTRRHHWKHSI
jgi:hypothetical protein